MGLCVRLPPLALPLWAFEAEGKVSEKMCFWDLCDNQPDISGQGKSKVPQFGQFIQPPIVEPLSYGVCFHTSQNQKAWLEENMRLSLNSCQPIHETRWLDAASNGTQIGICVSYTHMRRRGHKQGCVKLCMDIWE